MDTKPLDNPFWSALESIHAGIALCHGPVARYPPQYAPFLGIADADAEVADAFDALIADGETVLMLGIAPRAIPQGWSLKPYRPLAQMLCEQPLPVADGPAMESLGQAQRDEVLALTALVYPHYFRERSMDLGRYFGFHRDGRLAAMIGERLGTGGARELSAICTHPDFLGRGYARRLTALLANDVLAAGRLPFLHVSYDNARAKGLYEHLGFRLRRDLGFWSLRRTG